MINKTVVLSMSSHGARLNGLAFRLGWVQYVPFKFELYVGDKEVLPPDLVSLAEHTRNFSLEQVEDIGPLTKSYYALQKHPDSVIMLLDDDNPYTPQWILCMVDSFFVHRGSLPGCVIGIVSRRIIPTPGGGYCIMQFGRDQPEWQKRLGYPTGHAEPMVPSYRNIILSGAPGSFLGIWQVHDDYFDKDLYRSVCPTQDEMWNWVQSVRLGNKHACLHTYWVAPPTIQDLQSDALHIVNTIEHEEGMFSKFVSMYPDVLSKLVLDADYRSFR